VLAQQAGSTNARGSEATLPEISVEAGAEAPYKTDKAANPKFTQPLLDTPRRFR